MSGPRLPCVVSITVNKLSRILLAVYISAPPDTTWCIDIHPAANAGTERTLASKMETVNKGPRATLQLTFLRRRPAPACAFQRGEEKLMCLSRGKVASSVLAGRARTMRLIDVCVSVTDNPASLGVCVCVCTREGGKTAAAGHCISLELLSSDTRLIVHLNTTTLSVARQQCPSFRLPDLSYAPEATSM